LPGPGKGRVGANNSNRALARGVNPLRDGAHRHNRTRITIETATFGATFRNVSGELPPPPAESLRRYILILLYFSFLSVPLMTDRTRLDSCRRRYPGVWRHITLDGTFWFGRQLSKRVAVGPAGDRGFADEAVRRLRATPATSVGRRVVHSGLEKSAKSICYLRNLPQRSARSSVTRFR